MHHISCADCRLQEPYARHFYCERQRRRVSNSSSHQRWLLTADTSLRAITRNLLATNPSSLTQSYKVCARNRLRRADNTAELVSSTLFQQEEDSFYAPTPSLSELLSRTRKLYGVGLGSSSLPLLTTIVRATIGIRWRERGDMIDLLAVIDNDISQAIQVRLL